MPWVLLRAGGGVCGGLSRGAHGLVGVLQVASGAEDFRSGRCVSHHLLAWLPQTGAAAAGPSVSGTDFFIFVQQRQFVICLTSHVIKQFEKVIAPAPADCLVD